MVISKQSKHYNLLNNRLVTSHVSKHDLGLYGKVNICSSEEMNLENLALGHWRKLKLRE